MRTAETASIPVSDVQQLRLVEALRAHGVGDAPLARAEEVVAVLQGLVPEPALLRAAFIDAALVDPDATSGSDASARESLREELAALVDAETLSVVAELGRLGELRAAGGRSFERLTAGQSEGLRKMLLALVSDPRLVLARLARQLVLLRRARSLADEARRRVALETREIFAPLANRLGVWSVKWELEDLAFRELEPDEYRRIAMALNERRLDRERYIARVCEELAAALAAADIGAQVYGRPKHIYSIHRKMQRKGVGVEQLFDVRAVRVVVDAIEQCYAALGIVHGRWPFIPGEFDDYIASPKENLYRSIHTAVIGPEERSLEIQIRTQEMQQQSELGVAAHWRYKEGSGRTSASYERKIEWVRQLLSPTDSAGEEADLIARVSGELFADRVYALTPRGEVVELPPRGTPLDFAYHVHTSLGHRCRGAKVNGRIVPLAHALQNGDVVEIITGRHAAPSRDWLVPEQGYLRSARSRAKLRSYFRRLDEESGARLPAAAADPEASVPPEPPVLPPRRASRAARATRTRSPVAVEGVGDLPITLARCCAPVRPQPIAGYTTLGRGVTIHRQNCPSLARMQRTRPERVLAVEWASAEESGRLPVHLSIEAFDRRGLLRDITDLIAREQLSIDGISSATDPDDRVARISVRLGVRDLPELERLRRQLTKVANVYGVRRV